MFRLYRSRRQTFVAVFAVFAFLNLFSYFYYVSPRLLSTKATIRQRQNEFQEPSFLGKQWLGRFLPKDVLSSEKAK